MLELRAAIADIGVGQEGGEFASPLQRDPEETSCQPTWDCIRIVSEGRVKVLDHCFLSDLILWRG